MVPVVVVVVMMLMMINDDRPGVKEEAGGGGGGGVIPVAQIFFAVFFLHKKGKHTVKLPRIPYRAENTRHIKSYCQSQ